MVDAFAVHIVFGAEVIDGIAESRQNSLGYFQNQVYDRGLLVSRLAPLKSSGERRSGSELEDRRTSLDVGHLIGEALIHSHREVFVLMFGLGFLFKEVLDFLGDFRRHIVSFDHPVFDAQFFAVFDIDGRRKVGKDDNRISFSF